MSISERRVDAISDAFVAEYADLDPVGATYSGITGHEDRLSDLTPDGFAAREGLVRKALHDALDASPCDDRERVAREAFLERLGLDVETADAGLARSQVSVIVSGLHDLRGVFDLMATDSVAGWEAICGRLAGVPDALAGYRTTLLEEAAAGRVTAARQYAEVAVQVRRWTGQLGETGDVFAELVEPAGDLVGPTAAAELAGKAAAASAAVADFGRFLETDLAPRGHDTEAVGREHYALASRRFLGAAVDLDETYAWGFAELERIETDMHATAQRLVPGGTVAEAVAALDADPARRVGSREEFRDWMQALADRTVDELARTHFDIPDPVRRLECRLAPTHDGGIYYTAPSEDFARPGAMWWSVPDGIEAFTTWREVTTVFHEGVPGHHLQVGHTVARGDLLNRWQRLATWVSGHGEGWALYAERLMDELGYLDDAGERLGMLDGQSFRAARVAVDIGMHLELTIPRNPWGWHEGERWTPDLGYEFMRAHSRLDDATLRFEVDRYLGWPGQAPSYKVGERVWLEARRAAQARHGDAFDLKAFHRAALDLGSLGLDPLRAALERL